MSMISSQALSQHGKKAVRAWCTTWSTNRPHRASEFANLAADLNHLPRPVRISEIEARTRYDAAELRRKVSSKRVRCLRLRNELGVTLKYPELSYRPCRCGSTGTLTGSTFAACDSLMRISVNTKYKEILQRWQSPDQTTALARVFSRHTGAAIRPGYCLQHCWLPGSRLRAALPKPNPYLHRGTANELRSLDPQAVIGGSGGALMYELFEGLVTVDQQRKAGPRCGGVVDQIRRRIDLLPSSFGKGLHWSDGAAC